MPNNELENFKKLVEIVSILRSPDGCPWDREQDHMTLRENLLEETYEALEAIEAGDAKHLKEELGDVLLQVVLHAQIADEAGQFNIEDVAKVISEKLIRRHPHVFSDVKVKDSDEVIENWEAIKKKEKPERKSALSGIASTLPALVMAKELSEKAVKVGFEWQNVESLMDCLQSEIDEFKEAAASQVQEEIEDELGDILFSIVNVARWHKINPETALLRANRKFKTRFQKMEELATRKLQEYSPDEFEELWQEAKKQLKTVKK
jgi:tetrapyrrole methylase family protein/MazG family protein